MNDNMRNTQSRMASSATTCRPAKAVPRREKRAPRGLTLLLAGVAASALVLGSRPARAETFTNFEAVNDMGVSTWTPSFPVVLTGVLLTDPNEMLDSTPNFLPWNSGANVFNLGGQWQVFVQAVTNNGRGGVECWMAQNYGNLPWEPHDGSDSYSDAAWTAEVARVRHDPATGYAFRKGDLVTITANGALFYGGQQNVNEEHSTAPAMDFTISLVTANYGLPTPETISLSAVVSTNLSPTGHYDIFDPTRQTGGEFYQGMRVRINGLTLVTTNGWNTNSDWSARYCTATDGEGRQFPLIHPLYDLGSAPTGRFDATGVFLQESGSGADGTFGYELFVQEITPAPGPALSLTPGGVLAWPTNAVGFQLETATNLLGGNWLVVTNPPAVVGEQFTLQVGTVGAHRFFRLHKPN